MYFKLRVIKDNKLVHECSTHSKRIILKNLRTINWQKPSPKVSIKVSYGKHLDVYGKLTNFDNEGEYDNKADLWLAFEAFTEKD